MFRPLHFHHQNHKQHDLKAKNKKPTIISSSPPSSSGAVFDKTIGAKASRADPLAEPCTLRQAQESNIIVLERLLVLWVYNDPAHSVVHRLCSVVVSCQVVLSEAHNHGVPTETVQVRSSANESCLCTLGVQW